MPLLLATYNPAKVSMWRWLLGDRKFDILTPAQLGIEVRVEEDGLDEHANALKKARHFHDLTGLSCLADDAGLHIPALGGLPGVKARRWNDELPAGVDDETWLEFFLDRMKDVPEGRRQARFTVAWALVSDKGESVKDVHKDFIIATDPVRPYPAGWPVASVSYYPEFSRRWHEMSEEERYAPMLRSLSSWDFEKLI